MRERTVDTAPAAAAVEAVADALQNESRGGQPRTGRKGPGATAVAECNGKNRVGGSSGRRTTLRFLPFSLFAFIATLLARLFRLRTVASSRRVAPRRRAVCKSIRPKDGPSPRIARGVNEPRNSRAAFVRPSIGRVN